MFICVYVNEYVEIKLPKLEMVEEAEVVPREICVRLG